MRQVTTLLVGALLLAIAVPESASARARRYRIRIRTNPPGASIYIDTKSSGVQGTAPHRLRLVRGRHKLILSLPGYQDLETDINVTRSDTFTFALSRLPDNGTVILNAGPDATGAEVIVDGQPSGTLPTSLKLKVGRHHIVAKRKGYVAWQHWVDITPASQQTVEVALKPVPKETATLIIVPEPDDALVSVDGRPATDRPIILRAVPVGPHVVTATKDGFAKKTEVVSLAAKESKTIRLVLVPKSTASAAQQIGVRVLCNVEGADIWVDGVSRGKAPVTVPGLAPGVHFLEAKKPGFLTAEQKVTVKQGEHQTVKLSLSEDPKQIQAATQPVYGTLIMRGAYPGAEVYLDGNLAGNLPEMKTSVDPGSHEVEVRLEGHEVYKRNVMVKAKGTTELTVALKQHAPSKEQRIKAADEDLRRSYPRGLSSYGSQLVPPRFFTADLSAGFPYFGEARLTTGLLDAGHFGADIAVELRTFGVFTEVGLMSKIRVFRFEPVWFGALLGIGGGGGPSARDTFYFNFGLQSSITFGRLLTLTFRMYGNFFTDRHCPSTAEAGEQSVCSAPPAGLSAAQMRDRFSGLRLMLSAILEVPVTTNLSVFGLIEGAPFQPERDALTGAFSPVMPDKDARIYGRAGVTFKF